MEIVHAFYQHVKHVYAEVAASGECSACRDRPLTHRFVAVPGVGHSHCSIFQSKEMLAAMFPDATVATMQAAREEETVQRRVQTTSPIGTHN